MSGNEVDNEEIETYHPEIVSQKKLDIEFEDESFNDIAEGGLIKTKLNTEVIIQRIARDLYKNASSGLRELYNNAARACRIANREYGDDAYVQITIDKANRQLIIEDINATGISIKRFKEVLLELGTSDNLDSHEVGQFGMGFASYTTLTSALMLESKSRVKGADGEYQNYKMMAKDGMSFQPVGKSTLQKFGTRLTMTMYEDVEIDSLLDTLKRLVKYSGIKTVLKLENYQGYHGNNGETVYEAETIKESLEALCDGEGRVLRIDHDDFEFVAVVSGDNMHTAGANYKDVLIVGTPIESELKFPFDQWILNIKNERKYKPMPDRDRMTEAADNSLNNILDEALTVHFDRIDINSYDEMKNSPLKEDFLWLCHSQDGKFTPEEKKEFYKKFNFSIKKAAMGKDASTHSISRVMSQYDEVIYMKNNTSAAVSKMENLLGSVFCFTFTKGKKNQEWESHLAWLEEFGVRTSTEVFKEHRIKIVQEKKELADLEIVCHSNHDGTYSKSHLDVEEIDENTMMIDEGNTNEIIKILRKGYCPFNIIKNVREFAETDVRMWSEFMANLSDTIVDTNVGAMTLEKFCNDEREKTMCKDYSEEFEDIAVRNEDQLILLSKEHFFGYRIWMYFHREVEELGHISVSTMIEHIAQVSLHDKKVQQGFNKYYNLLPKCHWPILAKLLSKVKVFNYHQIDEEWDKKVLGNFEAKFEYCKTLPRFSTATPYTIVKGYQEILDKLNRESDDYRAIYDLMSSVIRKIDDNKPVFLTAMKKLVLPALFNDFDVRYMKQLEEHYSYTNKVRVTLRTSDKQVNYHDSFQVHSWHISVEILTVTREDDFLVVTMEVQF